MDILTMAKANVTLAIAAPELLESLKALVCLIEQSDGVVISKNGPVVKARSLIAELERR